MKRFFTILLIGLFFSLPTLAQVTNGLAYHFPFDWSLKSITSLSIDETPKGDYMFSDGKLGAGISFGSDSSEGQVIVTPVSKPDWEEFSVSLWLKANPNPPPPFVTKNILEARYDDRLSSYQLTQSRHNSLDSVAIVFSIRDYSNDTFISSIAIIDSGWNHITCTAKTEDSIAIYVNGDRKAVVNNPLKRFFFINEFLFGSDEEVYACPVGSIIDDVKIYRRQLLEGETRKLASDRAIKFDLSGGKIFPNPVRRGELLTMDFPNVGEYSIKLFSPSGENVETWNHQGDSKLFLDLMGYPTGIYLLSIFDLQTHTHFSKSIVLMN